jgi:hypothetical protein
MPLKFGNQFSIRNGILCATFAVFLFSPFATPGQTWQWTLEDIDFGGAGASIVTDHDGNLHLSYYLPTGGQLKYAFRSAETSTWYKMTLESNLNVLDTGITVDSNNNPQICYTPISIRYARWNGHSWLMQEVDPGSGRIAFICSIRVAPDGRPMMTWYLESGTYLRYAVLQDGAWLARSIDGGDSMPGKWNAMVLDAKGLPHVSYSDWPTGQLKYARFDGKNWLKTLVDAPDPKNYSGGQRSMGNSLVLDSKGRPLISYYDEQSLRLARLVDGVWKEEIVERLPPFGKLWGWKNFRSSLVLDSKGFPHIGFESRLGLEHAWWDGERWRTQLLLSTLGSPQFENSMTIDQNDNLYMIFRDPADGSLRIATGRPMPASTTASANTPVH